MVNDALFWRSLMTANHGSADPKSDTAPMDTPSSSADANQAEGAEQLDPVTRLEAELAAALVQVAEHKDQVLRAHAEMENVRRRAQEEVSKARKFGIESFAESMVPVKDSLEAALAQAEQTQEDLRSGIEMTLKQLTSGFERNHLKEIAPVPGTKFDPHHHQAIATVPAEQEANTVVLTLQKGYLIADRVLRPALVTVAA
jgi:molecular chaperone GrpE